MFVNSSILDVTLTLHQDKSSSAVQPVSRHCLCHPNTLQQVCGTGHSQGSTAVPCREHMDMECQAHTDPLPSDLQKEKPVLADCRLLSRVTGRAAGGGAGKAPSPCQAQPRCCCRALDAAPGAGPAPGTAGDCCWAQNNDFTLLMPHPQSTTVCATQRLIHAPVGFVGCYSLVPCMQRHGIRKSFHPDAGSLILLLSRERTE